MNQGVLEGVGRLGREPPLYHNFCRHQLHKRPLEGRGVQGRDGLHHLIGKRAPDRGPQLRHGFRGGEAVQPRQEGIMQGGGDRQWGQRAVQRIPVLLLLQ